MQSGWGLDAFWLSSSPHDPVVLGSITQPRCAARQLFIVRVPLLWPKVVNEVLTSFPSWFNQSWQPPGEWLFHFLLHKYHMVLFFNGFPMAGRFWGITTGQAS